MTESLAQLWSRIPVWAVAAIVVLVAWVIARAFRTRKPAPPKPTLTPPLAPDDPANLDSSHVGGPLFDGSHAGPITKGGAS